MPRFFGIAAAVAILAVSAATASQASPNLDGRGAGAAPYARACTDRLIVGGMEAGGKPVIFFIESQRVATSGEETRFSNRMWASWDGGIRLLADESWTASGDPCQIPEGKRLKISKPEGDRISVELDTGKSGRIFMNGLKPPSSGAHAIPLKSGFMKFSSTWAMVNTGGRLMKAAVGWFEAEHSGADEPMIPEDWMFAYNPSLETWMTVKGSGGVSFSSFTNEGGQMKRNGRWSANETSVEQDPSTGTTVPHEVVLAMPWAEGKIDMRFNSQWIEPVGLQDRAAANAIMSGFGHCADPMKHLHTLTAAAWLRHRKPAPPRLK